MSESRLESRNQPTPLAEASASPARKPGTLIALIIFTCLHLVVDVVIFLYGIAHDNEAAMGGGFVSIGFYGAILVGLIRMREWARIMIIWLAYCGIVSSLGMLAPLELPILVLSHWPSTRNATKGASLPKAYTYHEPAEQKEGEAR